MTLIETSAVFIGAIDITNGVVTDVAIEDNVQRRNRVQVGRGQGIFGGHFEQMKSDTTTCTDGQSERTEKYNWKIWYDTQLTGFVERLR